MKKIIYFITCITILAGLSGGALAKNDKGQKPYRASDIIWSDRASARITISIGGEDRDIIRSYLRRTYAKKCPPGLAKKNNGCLPPGIAKKYRVGQPLPHDVLSSSLSSDLLRLLTPAPRGYTYVQVDRDVLLVGEATKKVVDAVTLLSAVGS